MAILPVNIARVSDLLKSNVFDSSINGTQAQLLQVQNELSTGKQVNQPSDNPSAAAAILAIQKTLSQGTAYATNIQTAQSQLGVTENSLSNLSNLLLQVQNIASKDVNTGTSPSQLQGDAQIVNSLITEIQSLANTQSNGVYVFGGGKSNSQPYVSGVGGIQFVGSTNPLQTQVSSGILTPTEISGPSVFGGLSAGITGTATLAPATLASTQISSLAGANGDGVRLGNIQVSDGTTTATINLSSAQTLGDVVSDINAAGVGVLTASLSANGINLSAGPSDNISVSESGSTTASDLGIITSVSGAGSNLTGSAINPSITPFTPLSSLLGGAGIDPSGFIITNGAQSKTITPSNGDDVESLLNSINGAGLGVLASINSAGNGINIQNITQGTSLTIGENGGATATNLGIRSFSASTSLSDLNNGKGVGTPAAGSTGDFTLTDTNGLAFNVSLAGATTVQGVLDAINVAAATAGSGVVAGLATTGNGISLSDPSGGPGNLSLQAINSSTAAADLGLSSPTSTSASSITGSDVNGQETPGLFSNLQSLANALQTGDVAGITSAAAKLQNDYTNATDANGLAGAKIQELQNLSSTLSSQNLATQTLLSNIQDTNMTTAISQFQTLQAALQGALLTTSKSQSLSLLNYL